MLRRSLMEPVPSLFALLVLMGSFTRIHGLTTNGTAPHFVLVHGAWHGAWCWYKLKSMMESFGYKVTALDLASSGINPLDANSVSTFDEYNKPLLDFMASLSDDEKVIMVGHSAAGLSLTQIIHRYPAKIQVAVFLAAAMLKFGFLTNQDRAQGGPAFFKYGDEVYNFAYGSGVDQPPTSSLVKKKLIRNIFYNMSPLEDYSLATLLMRPCPIRAVMNAKFTEERHEESWKKVSRVYIKTLHDKAIELYLQDAMIKRWPPSRVLTIDSDHSPFFSNPSALATLLVNAASFP